MKETLALSSYQLYAISKNNKLAKEIRNAANAELDSRDLSTEEYNVITKKYKSLSGSDGLGGNKAGRSLFFIMLFLFLPPAVFFPSKIVLCIWSCFFAFSNKQYFKIQQRTVMLYMLLGFVFWTIIVIIADRYFL